MIFTENKEGVPAIRATKYKNLWRKNLLAHAHLWRESRESTLIEYSSQKMAKQARIVKLD